MFLILSFSYYMHNGFLSFLNGIKQLQNCYILLPTTSLDYFFISLNIFMKNTVGKSRLKSGRVGTVWL